MLEIAGFLVSGIGLGSQLAGQFSDWASWEEGELEVDRKWLEVAIAEGVLAGPSSDFVWSHRKKVARRELQRTHDLVIVFNENDRSRRRIVRDGTILMRTTSEGRS